MNESERALRRGRFNRIWLAILTIAFVSVAGLWVLDKQVEEAFQLQAGWSGDLLHVYSIKDGPWLVTHLIVYGDSGYWQAIAQLPQPVTIVDSAGHYFSKNDLDVLEWKDLHGKRQSPPSVGESVGLMYVVPSEGRRPAKKAE
jgi:hypothetical protein